MDDDMIPLPKENHTTGNEDVLCFSHDVLYLN